MPSPKGPYRLVTVNTAPDRARRIVGQAIEALKDRYTIQHIANCESIDQVAPTVSAMKPDILVSHLLTFVADDGPRVLLLTLTVLCIDVDARAG